MTIFYWLLLAHLVGDYLLQTDWVYAQKIRSLAGGRYHAGILFVCYALALWPLLIDWRVVLGVLIMTALHFAQDFWKASRYDHPTQNALPGYLVDQFVHVSTYAAFAALYNTFANPVAGGWWTTAWQAPYFWGAGAAGLLLFTFFWDVTAHVAVRHRLSAKTYQRNWRGMLWRGAVWLVVFGVWVI